MLSLSFLPFVIKRTSAVAGLFLAMGCQPAPSPDPTLVLLVAVDQLRGDMLQAFDPVFTGGLRRILDEGLRFENGTHDHAATATAPGHHTLSTGVHPTRHGVVGNEWLEQFDGQWRSVYSVEDLDRTILGYPEAEGRGPANGYRSGLPDWMLANDPLSRVVSLSRKDRAAIGLAAQARGEVYWLSEAGGEFVTSDYYHSEYPEWIQDFNTQTLPGIYADSLWESMTPPSAFSLARPDSSDFERGGGTSTLPYRAADRVDVADPMDLNRWRYQRTPFPDRAVIAAAIEAIHVLELGQRGSVDYLGLGLSQTDVIGHRFGPRSREQLDNLVRLDLELGRLLDTLDQVLGPEGWILALSADHGILEIPEHLAEQGVDASRLTSDDRTHFRQVMAEATEGDATPETVKSSIEALPFVAAAYTFNEIESGTPADSFATLFANSHSRTRVAGQQGTYGVYMRRQPNILSWGGNATTHGSPYYYDRHVPIIFMGAGVSAGLAAERVATIDVAPTLARITNIPTPDDLDGRVLDVRIPD